MWLMEATANASPLLIIVVRTPNKFYATIHTLLYNDPERLYKFS